MAYRLKWYSIGLPTGNLFRRRRSTWAENFTRPY